MLQRPRRLRALGLCLALLALPLAGCRSSDTKAETRPFVPLPDPEPDSIGFFLTEFDASLRAWNNLRLSGRGERDARTRRSLEKELGQRARRRQDELVAELETGPPTNRSVAAVALGFTRDPVVLSPLCAALTDQEPDVVLNALLGIGELASPDTPPAEICYLLRNDNDPWIRNNAAFALQSIVAAGATPTEAILEACREALGDSEAGVRAQCASTLGMAHDAASTKELGDLLYDSAPLASAAAATALGSIGREVPEAKGRCARLLADALDRTGKKQRPILIESLASMSEVHFGDDSEPWVEWARKLPP